MKEYQIDAYLEDHEVGPGYRWHATYQMRRTGQDCIPSRILSVKRVEQSCIITWECRNGQRRSFMFSPRR